MHHALPHVIGVKTALLSKLISGAVQNIMKGGYNDDFITRCSLINVVISFNFSK